MANPPQKTYDIYATLPAQIAVQVVKPLSRTNSSQGRSCGKSIWRPPSASVGRPCEGSAHSRARRPRDDPAATWRSGDLPLRR